MARRMIQFAPWLSFSGVIAILLGLLWDARIHQLNPDLDAHEGVFTLSNPAHLLFASGIAVSVASSLLYLFGLAFAARGHSWLRHKSLVVVALGLLFLTLSSFSAAMQSDDGLLDSYDHDHTTAPVTAAQQVAANKLVVDSNQGASRFADYSVAQADGYRQVTRYYLGNGSFGPAHFQNMKYVLDGQVLDTEHPEDLVYLKLPDGRMQLLGVMYLAPTGQAPDVGGSLTHWHSHNNLCIDRQGMVADVKNIFGKCPSGTTFYGPTPDMLHVWLVDNPGGPFADSFPLKNALALVKQAAVK